MIRATFEANTTEDMERWAVQFLTEQGYSVTKELYPVEHRETPQRFARRIGISASLLSNRLHAPDCPPYRRCMSEGGKRTRWLIATPDLESFCRRHLEP